MKTYITNKKHHKVKGRQTAVCLFWLVIWQAASVAVDKPLILSGAVGDGNGSVFP